MAEETFKGDRLSVAEDPALAEAKRRMGQGMAVQPQTPATRPALAPVENPPPPQLSTGMGLPPAPHLRDMPAPQPADDRNPLEVFDIFKNPAIVLAGLGSLFTRQSLTTAFNSGAGAINGYRSGQKQVFEENKERWHQAATQALEQNQTEITKYKIALEQRDMKARMATMYALASQYDDPIIKAAVENGNPELAEKVILQRESVQTSGLKAMQMSDMREREQEVQIERLKKDPNVIRDAEEIINLKKPAYTNVLRNPRSTATMAVVEERAEQQGKPFDQGAYGKRMGVENAFARGKERQTLRSLDNAFGHLSTLDHIVDSLGSGNFSDVNRVMQAFGIRTGSGEAVTSFKLGASVVGSEVAKALQGSGAGSLTDREEIRQNINAATSPNAIHAALKTARELLGQQFETLKQEYESGGGQSDFDSFIRPHTLKTLKDLQGGGGSIPSAEQSEGLFPYKEVQ